MIIILGFILGIFIISGLIGLIIYLATKKKSKSPSPQPSPQPSRVTLRDTACRGLSLRRLSRVSLPVFVCRALASFF